ncbi:assimilatory sulfite reductase (NADPH) hemoprotein subunit [Geomicrobium sediminis]|uniref:Sulfite reductase [NADPH] hemoprotein beta-component n=1 Tax=Geomicrobium sediminis TaxID=1347788 RepID=A0ABS2PAH3_9BACL|nr:assimilatory sulfite reductase (NADPH) hemoprotein subunit [Geomicrobium sediminis]MBM7632312.1 sulfite reductase (NADPH) hemoprotein beta-component [Geomicrobium sediminis]
MANEKNVHIQNGPPSDVEEIKEKSNYLRGTLEETLANSITAGIPDEDNRLMKFHGSYLQDDRDLRNERRKQKLEPAHQFMVRVRAPGGVATPKQWLAMDELATQYGNGTLKLTTRQAFQIHGIIKWNMKETVHAINKSLMDTLAACGDVNRNVMLNPNPDLSSVHQEVYEWASKLSEYLSPRTRAYHEIWLGEEKITSSKEDEQEPMYGKLYLPRKFKMGIAIPPSNDVDVFSQDIGLIAIIENDKLTGFNVSVGGGMGMTHGDDNTYPQLSRMIGFCTPEQVTDVSEKLITIQRDYGNRNERKYARFKYTIDARGLDWLKTELHERLGYELAESKPFDFTHNGDRYGWVKGANNRWNYTLFIQNGRIKDDDDYRLMTALRDIAHIHTGEFRLSANQNLVISNITAPKKKAIRDIFENYNIVAEDQLSALRKSSMACVSFPTCGLAMAESERYLPSLVDKLEETVNEAGLRNKEIVIRMSGCPNGCSRAALAEIGFIGKAPGKYNLYLGGGFKGERLSKMYKENIGEEEILSILRPLLIDYGKNRETEEHFGDYVIRAGYIKETSDGTNFHQ